MLPSKNHHNLRFNNLPSFSNVPPSNISPTPSTTSTSSSSRITVTLSKPNRNQNHFSQRNFRKYGQASSSCDQLDNFSQNGYRSYQSHHQLSLPVDSSQQSIYSTTSGGSQTENSTNESVISTINVPTLSLPSRDEIRAIEKKFDELTKKLEQELETEDGMKIKQEIPALNSPIRSQNTQSSKMQKSLESPKTPLAFCGICKQPITKQSEGCRAFANCYHIYCFTCNLCQKQLAGCIFYEIDGNNMKIADDKNSNNNPASSPVLSVRSTDSKSCSTTSSLNGSPRLQRFRNHPAATSSHFQVSSLNYIINPSGSINLQRQHSSPVAVAEPKKEKKKTKSENKNKQYICETCYNHHGLKFTAELCHYCDQPIVASNSSDVSIFSVETLDRRYHIGCFRCNICGISLAGKDYTIDDQYRVVCAPDENESHQPNCLELALGIERKMKLLRDTVQKQKQQQQQQQTTQKNNKVAPPVPVRPANMLSPQLERSTKNATGTKKRMNYKYGTM